MKYLFTKGHKINLGRKPSVEARIKMSIAAKGKSKPWLKGKKRSEESRMKQGLSRKGHLTSEETRRKISDSHKGEKSYNWKGGISDINKRIRKSVEFKLWREAVFERDNYTCIWCGIRGGNGKRVELHPDHIKPFALFPEFRFVINNGRTLCKKCHTTTDTWGVNKKNNLKERIEAFK